MITRKEIKHVVRLARIELNEAEEKKLEKDLGAILEFVNKLNGINTEGVEPMSGGTILENAMRQDKQIDKNLEGKSVGLLETVPDKKDGWVKVRAVFE